MAPGLRGSAQVEAAMLVPLVVFIIAGMISLGSDLYAKTAKSSALNTAAAGALSRGGTLPAESILRGRWHLK